MKRGSVVAVVLPGDLGKPRPAVIIQSDLLAGIAHSVVVLPMTSKIIDAPLLRLTVEPTAQNGLRTTSQIMVDKISTVPLAKLGQTIGQLQAEELSAAIRLLMALIDVP